MKLTRSTLPSLRALALLLLLLSASARAQESWPQFRGPDGQGHATAQNLPNTFSETQNVVWKTPLPSTGWSSPVIMGEQIWMTTAEDEGHSLRALCIERNSGQIIRNKEVFRVSDPVRINKKNSFASPTSVIEPGRLYVNFGTMGTACLDTSTANVLWTNRDETLDHKEGPGSSPIVFENLIIFHCDGIDVQYVVALDKTTGKQVWKTTRSGTLHPDTDRRKAYCTPLVINAGGRDELISPTADRVWAYDPRTGKEIWHVEYSGYSNVPRPVQGQGMLYICTGFSKPQMWAIRPQGDGDITAHEVAWRNKGQIPANSSPVVVDDLIYVVSDHGVATCIDSKDGTEVWRERLGGNYSASPLYAPNKIYFLSEEGNVTVIKPGRKYEVLAKNTLDGRLMASMAVADKAIYLRSDTHLYRIEQR